MSESSGRYDAMFPLVEELKLTCSSIFHRVPEEVSLYISRTALLVKNKEVDLEVGCVVLIM